MDIQLRPIQPDEFLAFARADSMGFGGQIDGEEDLKELEDERPIFEFDRSLAARDGERIVGTGGIFTFQLTVPGHITVPAAGVSWISVLPTHRRRGILTSIMRRQLADVKQGNEPLAILWASESIIYGRFGYGTATLSVQYELDPRHGRFARSFNDQGGMRFVDKEEAVATLAPIYENTRLLHPGALTRRPEWWPYRMRDRERSRRGFSARFVVVHETTGGEPDGYVTYRVKESWEGGFPGNTLRIVELIAANPDAYAALWQYLVSVDLMGKIEFSGTLEEPLRWLLADSRRLCAKQIGDGLWVRLVDIPAALAGRRYLTEDRLVFDVTDTVVPENSGCYQLEGSPNGAECKRTSIDADLALDVADLGATYLGGVSFGALARANLVREMSPGALRRANLMFASETEPYCETGF